MADASAAKIAQGAAMAETMKSAVSGMESGDAFVDGAGVLDATLAPDSAILDANGNPVSSSDSDSETSPNLDSAEAQETGAGESDKPKEDETKEGESKPEEKKAGTEEEFDIDGQVVKVDFSDAGKRKQLVHAASQRVKALRQRDRLAAENKELKGLAEKGKLFDQINDPWVKAGGTDNPVEAAKALLNKLMPNGQLVDRLVKDHLDLQAKIAKMSPAEKAAYASDNQAKIDRAEAAEAKAKLQKIEDDARSAAEAQSASDRQAAFDSAFEKVSFTGKLGDDVAEERLNAQMFAAAREEMANAFDKLKAKYGEDGMKKLNIAKLANKILTTQRDAIQRVIKVQAQEGATEAVEKAKAEAGRAAQAVVNGGTAGAKGGASEGGQVMSAEEAIQKFGHKKAMQMARAGQIKLAS